VEKYRRSRVAAFSLAFQYYERRGPEPSADRLCSPNQPVEFINWARSSVSAARRIGEGRAERIINNPREGCDRKTMLMTNERPGPFALHNFNYALARALLTLER
jgi:hypothetical protein